MDGVDVLLHLAGIAHQRADPSSYQRVNVDASLNLARNALAAGVKRFVFVSSVKAAAVAAPPSGDKAGRSSPSDYARSKASAESGLADICRDSAMQLVIVRPALIYSPDALGHLRWLRRWAELRLPAPPEGGGRSMVAREDVVRLLLMLSDVSLEVPGLLTVTDGEVYSTRRLYEALCQSLGRKPWLPTPPPALWRGASGLFDQLRNDAPGTLWERLLGDDCYAPEGLDALGFEPALSFEQSIGVRS
jgi:nucleoside-diphosphate-sugar epimerase